MALSTTHVATGSILGSGVGKPGARVRWGVAGRMVVGWLLTLPAAAVVGAACFITARAIDGLLGAVVIFLVMVVVSAAIFIRSRREKVDRHNVNAEWDKDTNSVVPGSPERSATQEVAH